MGVVTAILLKTLGIALKDEGRRLLRNVGKAFPIDEASQARRRK
jgi:hypothetical protein